MRALRFVAVLLVLGLSRQASAEPQFMAVDVYLNSAKPVAAWQFEFFDRHEATKIVGIENGESKVFGPAPYYDRDALASGLAEHIKVADYSLADRDQLPKGRVRIATLHVMVASGRKPDFRTQLIIASTHGGEQIEAVISIEVAGGDKE